MEVELFKLWIKKVLKDFSEKNFVCKPKKN